MILIFEGIMAVLTYIRLSVSKQLGIGNLFCIAERENASESAEEQGA